MSTFNVRIFAIRKLPSGSQQVRWMVAGRHRQEAFRTKALADGYRARLLRAAREGEPFDEESGLPLSMAQAQQRRTWYQHARAYAEMKWPTLAAKSRRSLAEALSTLTPALVSESPHAPDERVLRLALFGWAFNPSTWSREMPDDVANALAWLKDASAPVTLLNDAKWVRKALVACSQTTRGRPAAATVTRRKRAVFYNALRYAVELELLQANPLDRVQWKAAEVAETVDRRVVANPEQVRSLLAALGEQGPMGEHLVPFFGCLYFAGMRPGEALALRGHNCMLPRRGWGRLNLAESEPRAGAEWTDDGSPRETRGLKHRG